MTPAQIRKMTINRIAFRATALTAVALAVMLSACNEGVNITAPEPQVTTQSEVSQTTPGSVDITHSIHAQNAIDFTGSYDDIWPPQPTNITNVTPISQASVDELEPQKKLQRQIQSRRTILNNSTLTPLMGENYAWLGSHTVATKSGNTELMEHEIFSYDTNTLIVVSINDDSGEITTVSETPAGTYQPAESQDEVKKAIELASTALQQQGFTEHEQLKGTALLAYPNAAETAESGNVFYSERKLYVTFGPGNGVLPHYRATVNLSRSLVESSGAME